MCLEFDSQCCTTQVEDSLQLYLPSFKGREDSVTNLEDYWPVLSKFSGTSNWPSTSIILPGDVVVRIYSNFSLSNILDISVGGYR
jgi:E3 ubiquitin-protein ligase MYCBP2